MTEPSNPRVEFGDLPPAKGPRSKHRGIAAQLRERPGDWARVDTRPDQTSAENMASAIRRAGIAAYRPAGAFQSAVRGCDVWARCVDADARPLRRVV